MTRAAIYARYSAGPNQTDQSIEGQLRVCEQYIKDKGLTYVGHYADRHISGKTDQRPEFQKMINDAEAGLFDALVVYSTDRFSRSKYDSAIYKKKLSDLSIKIYYAAENIPDGPEGILMEALMEGWAQYYSEELSRKIKRGMHDSAIKGKHLGSFTPIGYKVTPDLHYEIDQEIAPYIVKVFEKYLAGSNYADLSRYLESKGFISKFGNPYNTNAIKKMLTNKKYIGVYQNAGVELEDTMPRIVSDELFYKVQDKMKANAKPYTSRGKFALGGKIYCGKCGKRITGSSGTGKSGKVSYYYICRRKCRKAINRDRLENFIVDQVKQVFEKPEELDNLAEKIYKLQLENTQADDDEKILKNKLAGIEKKLDNLVDILADRPGSKALLDKLDALEDQKADLTIELALVQANKKPALSLEAIRAGIQVFLNGFYFDDSEKTKERILSAFIKEVTLFEDQAIITFNITGLEGPKISQIVFDQNDTWWSSSKFSRTLKAFPDGFALICDISVLQLQQLQHKN